MRLFIIILIFIGMALVVAFALLSILQDLLQRTAQSDAADGHGPST
jgi:hypothetical protein